MRNWKQAIEEVREQQARDFTLVMGAFAQVRDQLGTIESGLLKHQEQTSEQLEIMVEALSSVDERFEAVERRLDKLENPAA